MKVSLIIIGLATILSTSYAQEDLEPVIDENLQCNPIDTQLPLGERQTATLNDITSTILSEQKAPFTLDIKSSTSKRIWENAYTDVLYQTLSSPDLEPLFKQIVNEDDLDKLNCPTFNYLNKEEKKKFYITYLAAIAENSSGFNNQEVYYTARYKTTNYGLLQIDPKSARAHAGSVIGKEIDGKQLATYQINLKAAAYILKHQVSGKIATGRLFPEKTYYWPSLKTDQKKILANFESNAKNLPFCHAPKAIIVDESTLEDAPPKAIIVNESALEDAPPRAILVIEENEETTPPKARIVTEDRPAPSPRLPTGQYRRAAERPVITKPMPIIIKGQEKNPPKVTPTYQADTRGLNVNGFAKRLKNLPLNSGGYCARGVRGSLNILFGHGPEGGPPAKEYDQNFLSNWRKNNSCFKKTSDSGDFQNYDIRVLEPKDSSHAGHIEIYFDGKWYSDFQQKLSLWNNGVSKYKSKTFFRLSDCSRRTSFIKAFLKALGEGIISESCANTPNITFGEDKPIVASDLLLAEDKEWKIKEVTFNQGFHYILFKGEEIITRDSNSPFILIDKIQDESLRKALVKDTLEKWIQKEGRPKVQEYILELEAMTKLQKESLTALGFTLPFNIEILGK
jgi:hypothetical protein